MYYGEASSRNDRAQRRRVAALHEDASTDMPTKSTARMHHRRIGLLGGSFNPAHAGHVHISLEALKRLQLDEIWWLVSPKNPLKAANDLAGYDVRLEYASALTTQHPRITVLDIEARQNLYYTIDTIRFLQARHRDCHFVWLMGADNLAGFHRWKNWRQIARRIPIAILDRAPFNFKSLHARYALAYAKCRVPAVEAKSLATAAAPCWAYITIPRHPLSATFLRKTLGKNAYVRHSESR